MEGDEAARDYGIKLNQAKSNLRGWNFYEWVIFWVLIPALLFIVYSLPQGIKDAYFILNTSNPWDLPTLFLSSYTHSQLYPHLVGNLVLYSITLLMIFTFENRRRRFMLVAGWSVLAVPVVSSLLTILFWDVLGVTTRGQGFSAINGAFLAYAMFIFVVWGVQDAFVVFDRPEVFRGTRIRLALIRILLIVLLFLVMAMGVLSGAFMDLGGSVSNGIAHFGGYASTLVVLFVFDERTERRRFFDAMLGLSILAGVIVYAYYLVLLVRLVRGS